jgi:3-deoxy-D-manno-octulosonic-acid transferase
VSVSGNQKFDALEAPHVKEHLAALLPASGDPLLVAGSTVPGEEPLVLAAFAALRAEWPAARLILAPRHPERCAAVAPLVQAAGFECVLRSTLAPGRWRGEVVVLDTLGELAQIYELASVVFVGGSLMPAGGHNILEPAVAGKAVVVGPHMENFQEIADTFRAEDALVQVCVADELGPALVSLMRDEKRRQAIGARAQALVARNRGAVARTVTAIEGLLA